MKCFSSAFFLPLSFAQMSSAQIHSAQKIKTAIFDRGLRLKACLVWVAFLAGHPFPKLRRSRPAGNQ
jgi:hypothetical protein